MIAAEKADGIVPVGFANRDEPRLQFEALTYTELQAKMRPFLLTRPSRPAFHQLVCVTGGAAQTSVDFTTLDMGPGTVLHVRPGQVQRLPVGADGRLAALDAIVLLFTADFPFPPHALLDAPDGPVHRHTTDPALPAAFDAALTEYRTHRTGQPATVLRHLLAVVLLRIAALDEGPALLPDALFARFRNDLELNFHQHRDLGFYASRLACSPKTLTRACLAATGTPAKAVVEARIVLEARRLLAHTDEPAAAIARRLGFSEATNFGKFFRHHTGQAPTAFRAAYLA